MPLPKVHVEQPLVGAIKADTPFRKCPQRIVVLHVRSQYHYSAVEAIGPADIWSSGKIHVQTQKLIRGANGYHIRIDVYDALELCLSPELDLGERGY
jgi:hypothetical protein